MPTYVYNLLNKDGSNSEEFFELDHSIHSDALEEDPETGRPCVRVPQTVTILIDLKRPNSLGMIAAQNTEKMIKAGDSRIKKTEDSRPWWRKDKKKPVDTTGWGKQKIERYIVEGKTS